MKALTIADAILLAALSFQGGWRVLTHGWWERELIVFYGTFALVTLFALSIGLYRTWPKSAFVLRVVVLIAGGALVAAAQFPQSI